MAVNTNSAAELKEKGNVAFKEGRTTEAAELYAKAEKIAKGEYVYPSNLSAALYELGDYAGCRDAIFRAWKLLNPEVDSKVALRLSTRLAKALSYLPGPPEDANGAQGVIERIRAVPQNGASDSDHERAWNTWDKIIDERKRKVGDEKDALAGFSALPMFRRTVDPTLEFYKIGQDPPLSIIQFWTPDEQDPMNLKTLPKKNLSELSFLFGGVGDGRHVFGSLIGLHQAYQGLPKEKRVKFKVHLTLLDIQPAVIARDLLMFMLLDQLVSSDVDKETEAEILACLLYVFLGTVMPSYCFTRLQTIIKDLRKGLSNNPPRLPSYIHIDSNTIPTLLDSLNYLENFSPDLTAQGILRFHRAPDAGLTDDPFFSGALKGLMETRKKARRAQASKLLDTLTPTQLKEMGITFPGVPVSQLTRYVADNKERVLDILMQRDEERAGGKSAVQEPDAREKAWYGRTNSFALPSILRRRHPGYEEAFQSIAKGDSQPSKSVQKVAADVQDNWKPNLTFFDRACQAHPGFAPGGYPVINVAFFLQLQMFDQFNEYMGLKAASSSSKDDGFAYNTMSTFFGAVARALKSIGHRVKTEIILGEHTAEMAKMRYGGKTSRPADFPTTFTRIWLSNVPDYTHGPMNVATLSIPNLQDQPRASVALNCLLNTGLWESEDHYCHAYTLLPKRDVPRFLGCRISRLAIFGTIIMERLPTPRPVSNLASRTELTDWLNRVFMNTILPPPTGSNFMTPRHPNNLVAFVHILFHLHSVGFPAHWLSEYVQSILSESLVTNIAPFAGTLPIPLSDMYNRVARRVVRTDPWLAELENIFVTAHEGLPFPVSLPAGFATSSADIGVFEARVEGTSAASPWGGHMVPMQPTTSLLFYKPSNSYAPHTVVRNLPQILEGKASPMKGDIQILSSQEVVDVPNHVIRWRMSKQRVRRMKEDGWVMSAYRFDINEPVILPVYAKNWRESHVQGVKDPISEIEQLELD